MVPKRKPSLIGAQYIKTNGIQYNERSNRQKVKEINIEGNDQSVSAKVKICRIDMDRLEMLVRQRKSVLDSISSS